MKLSADLWLDTAVLWKTTPTPAFATAPELFPDPGQRNGVLSGKLFGVQKQGEVGNQKSSAGTLLISLFFSNLLLSRFAFCSGEEEEAEENKAQRKQLKLSP